MEVWRSSVIRSTIVSGLRKTVFRGHSYLGRFKDPVWLLGDARSGTTWTASLINYDKSFRELFEPFNHRNVDEMRGVLPQLYLRPDEEDEDLEVFANRVFKGTFSNQWSDFENKRPFYRGLLIKDVWANLFSFWASRRFPEVKKLFLIRNPFAVALSKSKTMHWNWIADPLHFKKQDRLFADFLEPYEDLMEKTSHEKDCVVCQVLIWCILNMVPLKQFSIGELKIVFYEDMYLNPVDTTNAIFEYIQRPDRQLDPEVHRNVIKKPSSFASDKSNVWLGTSPLTTWKNELNTQQIDKGLEILHRFGFSDLYAKEDSPNIKVIEDMQRSG